MTKPSLKLLTFALFCALATPTLGIRAQHRAHLSADLLAHEANRSPLRVNVIVAGSPDTVEGIARQHGLSIVKWLSDGAVLSANSDELTSLAADSAVENLSGDARVRPDLAVSNRAMLADQTRAGTPGLLGIGGISGVTGSGIGVAVIDSGIAPHAALKNKVIANVSFVTGDPSVVDTYGHGTHVAGIIAGAANNSFAGYTSGIAPGVQLINVRVLGGDGTGYTSDVIAGIDWTVANRARYNIRIINLSLGHPVAESSTTDPLCLAVQRAVQAGIVVVAAAGNEGRAPNQARELGGITSPGNSPYAITVGALDTFGTPTRADDAVADYSSRGPTEYDFAMKPDVVAPGSAIVSLEAQNSYLITKYPFLHRGGSGSNAYMQLSGTSMAAPMISGAAALLLQGSPSLTPAHIKLALQSGATYMQEAGIVGGGAGSVNVWASRIVTANGLTSLLNSVTSLLGLSLADSSGASFWDAGTMSQRLYNHTGIRLLSILNLGSIWANPSLLNFGDLNLIGLTNPLGNLGPNPLMYGGLTSSMDDDDQIIWGTTIYDSSSGQSVVWGTDDEDQIIWGTSEDPTLTAANPQ